MEKHQETGPMNRDPLIEEIYRGVQDLRTEMREFKQYMHGTPPDKPGVLTRMDRLEQATEDRKWKSKTLWTISLGALITSIAAAIKTAVGGGP